MPADRWDATRQIAGSDVGTAADKLAVSHQGALELDRPIVSCLVTMKESHISPFLSQARRLHMATALRHDLVSPRIEERLRRGQLTSEQVEAFATSWTG